MVEKNSALLAHGVGENPTDTSLASRTTFVNELSMLEFSVRSREIYASAGAWNFGLCATRSREPRQARKGATVPGSPRVPQITRSSSHRNGTSCKRKFLVFSSK